LDSYILYHFVLCTLRIDSVDFEVFAPEIKGCILHSLLINANNVNNIKAKFLGLATAVVPALVAVSASATTTDLTAFDNATDQGVNSALHMIGLLGEKGVLLYVAAIAAAIVIVLIGIGLALGWSAMKGKVGKKKG